LRGGRGAAGGGAGAGGGGGPAGPGRGDDTVATTRRTTAVARSFAVNVLAPLIPRGAIPRMDADMSRVCPVGVVFEAPNCHHGPVVAQRHRIAAVVVLGLAVDVRPALYPRGAHERVNPDVTLERESVSETRDRARGGTYQRCCRCRHWIAPRWQRPCRQKTGTLRSRSRRGKLRRRCRLRAGSKTYRPTCKRGCARHWTRCHRFPPRQ